DTDGGEDEDEDEGEEEEPRPVRRRRRQPQPQWQPLHGPATEQEPGKAGSRRKGKPDPVRAYLESQSAGQLLDFILDLAERFPQVRKELKEKATLATGEVAELIRQARREIAQLSAEASHDSWGYGAEVLDCSGLRRRLQNLLDRGQADALLDLGEQL